MIIRYFLLGLCLAGAAYPQGAPIIQPRVQYANGAGVPYAGAYLCTFTAGTTTPTTTWSNGALTTPNTNPIVLDGNGAAQVFINPALSYKYILYSGGSGACPGSGTVVFTEDNIIYPTGGGGGGGLPSCTIGQLVFYATTGSTGSCLALGTNLSITSGVLNASGGGSSGSGTDVSINCPVSPTDATTCIQAAITAATNVSTSYGNLGGDLFCPNGNYVISSTLTAANTFGLNMRGGQECIFTWAGTSTSTPMFDLQNVADSNFEGFRITVASGKTLAEAFRIENATGGTVAWRHNTFNGITIQGVAGQVGIGFRGKVGTGGDVNGDTMLFINDVVSNYSVSAFSIEGTQMNEWKMINCTTFSDNYGKYTVYGGTISSVDYGSFSNFHWDGGLVGDNTVADFFIAPPSTPALSYSITNGSSEGSKRFIITPSSGSGSASRVTVDNFRWADNALASDGVAIEAYTPGPWIFRNSSIGESGSNPLSIKWTFYIGDNEPYFEMVGCTIFTSYTTNTQVFNNPGAGSWVLPQFIWGTILMQNLTTFEVADKISFVNYETGLTTQPISWLSQDGIHAASSQPGGVALWGLNTSGTGQALTTFGAIGGPEFVDLGGGGSQFLMNEPGASAGYGWNICTYAATSTTGNCIGSQNSTFQFGVPSTGAHFQFGSGTSASITDYMDITAFGPKLPYTVGSGCSSASDVGQFYFHSGGGTANDELFICRETSTATYALAQITP